MMVMMLLMTTIYAWNPHSFCYSPFLCHSCSEGLWFFTELPGSIATLIKITIFVKGRLVKFNGLLPYRKLWAIRSQWSFNKFFVCFLIDKKLLENTFSVQEVNIEIGIKDQQVSSRKPFLFNMTVRKIKARQTYLSPTFMKVSKCFRRKGRLQSVLFTVKLPFRHKSLVPTMEDWFLFNFI